MGGVAFSGGAWHPDSLRVGVPGILTGSALTCVPPRCWKRQPEAGVGGIPNSSFLIQKSACCDEPNRSRRAFCDPADDGGAGEAPHQGLGLFV